jgi:methionyl-tRNA formyltransferase
MKFQLLIDNPQSWMWGYATSYVNTKSKEGLDIKLLQKHDDIIQGDILCMLSCEKKFKNLHLNKFNLVVHESDLPKGRGMSPFTWQIIEGNNQITVCLLEAVDEIDAGVIYDKIIVNLNGTELVDEWRALQADATFKLLNNFIAAFPNINGTVQTGEPTYYPRRTMLDSKLDINKSIKEQFNLLRVSDNERYPAWFEINGTQYELKISKKST